MPDEQPNPTAPTPDAAPEKPGWQTTEFWLTLFVAIPNALHTAGLLAAGDTGLLSDNFSKMAAGIVAAITLWKYCHGRTSLKLGGPTAATAPKFPETPW